VLLRPHITGATRPRLLRDFFLLFFDRHGNASRAA
jgi:hypothetical protein